MGGGAILKADGIAHLLSHANLLARAVDEFELALGEEDRKRHTGKAATRAEVENTSARAEIDNLGYGQRVEHVVLVDIIDILARNDIDLSVPIAVELAKGGKLLQLGFAEMGEVFVNNLCVHYNVFKNLGLIKRFIWA